MHIRATGMGIQHTRADEKLLPIFLFSFSLFVNDIVKTAEKKFLDKNKSGQRLKVFQKRQGETYITSSLEVHPAEGNSTVKDQIPSVMIDRSID